MRIAIGSDHRGFALKEGLKELLGELKHEWVDFGCQGEEPVVDYPDIARPLAQAVARGELDVGILICLTREDEKGLYAVVPDLPEAVRNPSRLHRRRLVCQEAVGHALDARQASLGHHLCSYRGHARDVHGPSGVLLMRPCDRRLQLRG